MKVEFTENGGCFAIALTPENDKEIVSLVRLGINKTKEVRGIYVSAYEDGKLAAAIVLQTL